MPRLAGTDNHKIVPVVWINAHTGIREKLAEDAYIPDLKDGALREYG